MGTTGAPWNIPFVEPTDIPRTYPQDSEDLALAIAAGLSAAGNPGIGSNVVQTVKTNVFTTTSDTFTDITGLTVDITPTSDTSKVLVICHVSLWQDTQNRPAIVELRRGSTSIGIGDQVGTNLVRASGGFKSPINPAQNGASPLSFTILDSPGVDTQVTYSLRMRRGGALGIAVVNRTDSADDATVNWTSTSAITVIEVAA